MLVEIGDNVKRSFLFCQILNSVFFVAVGHVVLKSNKRVVTSQIHSFANKRGHFKIKHTSLFVNFVLEAFPDHLVVACDLSFRLLGRRGPGEGSGNGFERVSSSAGFL